MTQRRSEPLGMTEGCGIVLKAAREPKKGRIPGVAGNVPSSPVFAFKKASERKGGKDGQWNVPGLSRAFFARLRAGRSLGRPD
ncbi:hypothetical protein [Paenibacillus validus]|uniref:hypothetical protein n=1 Tax=Paenibacillus validus TaxID=44253 RepID=UPI003D29E7AA